MKIINNKIYIAKGETATYDANAIDKDTGMPFMLPKGINNPIVEFIVRPSIYDRDDDYVFKAYLIRNDKRFDGWVDYTESQWDNDYPVKEADKDKLFRRKSSTGIDYRYYDENATGTGNDYKWIPYEFNITFTFPYEATSMMEAKQYNYEITLFGGTLKGQSSEDVLLSPPEKLNGLYSKIEYKFPILEATEFFVGGSLSE